MSELLGVGNNDAHEIVFTVSAGTNHATPVDDTLSIEGMAADAKATGDAIDTLGATIQSQIDTLDSGKVAKTDIANNLTTTASGKVLDAKQGYVLKGLVDAKSDKQGGFTVASGSTATVKMNSSFRGLLLAFGVSSGLCGAWMLVTNEQAGNVGIAVELICGNSIELTGTNATKTFTNNGSYAVTLFTLCFNGDCTVTVNS